MGHIVVDHAGTSWIVPGHDTADARLAVYQLPSYQTQRCYEAAGWRVVDLRKEGNTARLDTLPWYDMQPTPWVFEAELSDEAIDEIAAEAKAGAEAGAPTKEELEAAAFEGAQQAERE